MVSRKKKHVELNTPAPDVVFEDFKGNNFRLSDYLEKMNVLLIFNRGFTGPYCRKHLSQLRQEHMKFMELNTEVIVIGPEGKVAFKKYWKDNKLPFIGIPDPKHNVLNLFGQEIKIFKFGRMPAQAIIDRQGIIRYLNYGASMSDIPKNKELLRQIRDLST